MYKALLTTLYALKMIMITATELCSDLWLVCFTPKANIVLKKMAVLANTGTLTAAHEV